MAFFAFPVNEGYNGRITTHELSCTTERMYLGLVRIGAERIADLLRRRLLALGLEGGRGRVGLALELVAHVLGGRLLRVGLHHKRR